MSYVYNIFYFIILILLYQIEVGLFFLLLGYSLVILDFFSMFHHDFVPEIYLIPKKYEEILWQGNNEFYVYGVLIQMQNLP